MKKWMSAILLLGYVTIGVAASPTSNTPSLVGKYDCKGFDPAYQHHYSGKLTVTLNPRAPKTYLVQEEFGDLDFQKDVGIGYIYNNCFFALFQDPSYGASLAAYTIKDNGDLSDGKFLYYTHTDKGLGAESCIKISSKVSGA